MTRFNHFRQNNKFGFDDGFAIAGAITAWDDGTAVTEDPSYGQIKIYIKSWGNGAPYDDFMHEIKTRPC